jgi:hypothetical protein
MATELLSVNKSDHYNKCMSISKEIPVWKSAQLRAKAQAGTDFQRGRLPTRR